MTYSELQAEVQTNIIDLPAAVTANVPTYVKRAVKALQRRRNFKVMETLSSLYVTTVATRVLAAVPSDFKELRGSPYSVPFLNGRNRFLENPANRVSVLEGITEQDDGYPQMILDGEPNDDGARNFEVWPLPDGNSDYSDGEYRIRVPYYRYLTELSSAGDDNWFTNNAEEFIIEMATSYGFSADWDEERALYWRQLAEGHFAEVRLADKLFRLGGVETLVPLYQGVNTPAAGR